MDVKARDFVPAAQAALRDPALRAAVKRATDTAAKKRLVTMFWAGRAHGEALRQQAAQAGAGALRGARPAEQAEAAMTANGIQVLWAADGDDAAAGAGYAARRRRRAVKSKHGQRGSRAQPRAASARHRRAETDRASSSCSFPTRRRAISSRRSSTSRKRPSATCSCAADMPPTDDAETMTRSRAATCAAPFWKRTWVFRAATSSSPRPARCAW